MNEIVITMHLLEVSSLLLQGTFRLVGGSAILTHQFGDRNCHWLFNRMSGKLEQVTRIETDGVEGFTSHDDPKVVEMSLDDPHKTVTDLLNAVTPTAEPEEPEEPEKPTLLTATTIEEFTTAFTEEVQNGSEDRLIVLAHAIGQDRDLFTEAWEAFNDQGHVICGLENYLNGENQERVKEWAMYEFDLKDMDDIDIDSVIVDLESALDNLRGY
jgi:hypothetical protein